MDKTKQEKVARFLDDKVMSEAVYGIMLESFLKPKQKDVQYLAASMIAVESLKDAWKEMEKFKIIRDEEVKRNYQVGL